MGKMETFDIDIILFLVCVTTTNYMYTIQMVSDLL